MKRLNPRHPPKYPNGLKGRFTWQCRCHMRALQPNPSIERTSSSEFRLPAAATHVKR